MSADTLKLVGTCRLMTACASPRIANNQIKSNQIKFICHKSSTQYNNELALRLAGQRGDNFALTQSIKGARLEHYYEPLECW